MDTNTLKEYIKIHRLSLEQDWQKINSTLDPLSYHWELRDLSNQIKVLDHILYVADEMEAINE
jgi:HD superfamily phosphohydrolase YqeK